MSSGKLQLTQGQSQQLSGEMLQSLHVLQMNREDLSAYIREEVEKNPVLESDFMAAPGRNESLEVYSSGSHFHNDDETHPDLSQYVSSGTSLEEYLTEQLGVLDLTDSLRSLCLHIIGDLDERGYLCETADALAKECGTGVREIRAALKVVQSLDPAGIAAGTLQECLLLQLDALGEKTPEMELLVNRMLNDAASGKTASIAKKLGVSRREAAQMIRRLRRLTPYPGESIGNREMIRYIIPDLILERDDHQLRLRYNENGIPSLTFSPFYQEMLHRETENAEVQKYLSGQFQSGRELLRQLDQRKSTTLRVAAAILRHQENFLRIGPAGLAPLTQSEIADETGLSCSTISRTVNGKYLQCSQGIYELKFFFSKALELNADAPGEDPEISAVSIRSLIRRIIRNEPPDHPLTDRQITSELSRRGIQISCRTTTKYRMQEGILPSYRRKRERSGDDSHIITKK